MSSNFFDLEETIARQEEEKREEAHQSLLPRPGSAQGSGPRSGSPA